MHHHDIDGQMRYLLHELRGILRKYTEDLQQRDLTRSVHVMLTQVV